MDVSLEQKVCCKGAVTTLVSIFIQDSPQLQQTLNNLFMLGS